MTPSTGDLPNSGQVIEFTDVPTGSLYRTGVRYRVEHKPGAGDYLIVDVMSGHAYRLMAHDFKQLTWGLAGAVEPVVNETTDAFKPATPTGGLLDLPPLTNPATQ